MKQLDLLEPAPLTPAARELLELVEDEPIDPRRIARMRKRVAAMLEAERTPTPAPAAVAECSHDRIVHESKSLSRCRACGVRMVQRRGDWRPQ